jgi:hypothetical protein
MAAIFLDNSLDRMTPGGEILAILPEVLRSGSNYRKWRKHVGERAQIMLVKPFGIFDESADIDVFLVHLRKRERSEPNLKRWPEYRNSKATVGSLFAVNVGRVVPFRNEENGPRYPYIHPRCVPPWKEMKSFPESVRFSGGIHQTPFVAIRRTSRPEHAYRAAATIITGADEVAVENHLIVCQPKDRKLATCRKLLRVLKTRETNRHLNRRIRCRHLTIESIASIRIWQK